MKKNRGMALVEIVIGSAIIAVGIFAASTSFSTYLNYALANQKNIQASYLLEEGLEVLAYRRDTSWQANILNLSTTTTYYLNFNGADWTITTTTPEYIGGEFLRSIRIYDVRRDSNDDIALSGTYDPNTKQITSTVDYFQGHATTTKFISTLITNLYNN